ncbi:MAG: peptidoglycan DD-metalloendopeptidase family protein [Chitinophagales bacterium]|nr:peptidoglycan DD-metalloendopeptidase family protein [Chitinophagales bacterium]
MKQKITIQKRADLSSDNLSDRSGKKHKGVFLPYWFLILIGSILLFLILYFLYIRVMTSQPANGNFENSIVRDTTTEEVDRNSFDKENYIAEEDLLQANINLAEYLRGHKLSEPIIAELVLQAEEKGLQTLEKNQEVVVMTPKNAERFPKSFIYRMAPNKSLLLKAGQEPEVSIMFKTIKHSVRASGGIIKTTLWEAVLDYNIHYRIIEQMEEAMKYSVDFFHLKAGDKFKVIYEEKWAGNEIIGIGRLMAVYFKTEEGEFFAFWVDGIDQPGYYNENGQSVKKPFLRCPVKYERITSGFSLERLHPKTGELKPHFGTDFAAPHGSPIFAVADGNIELADFTTNNGNYVKIKHDAIYETQYLHMDRYAVTPGQRVKQGDVIGYVGQTGLATGPHVCFRFWKYGKQVDPRAESPTQMTALGAKDYDHYLERKSELWHQLREIVYFDGHF